MRDQADPSAVGPGGVKPTLEQLSIESTAAAQDALITALIHTAGLPDKKGTPVTPLGARDANWSLVYKAGV